MTKLELWLDYLKDEDKSNNTIDSYKRDVVQFINCIQKEVESLTKDDITKFKNILNSRKLSIKTINRKLVSINSFLDFLNKELNININVKIKQEKVQNQEYLEEMLSKKDFQDMVIVAKREKDMRAVAIFYTLFLTGMRVSEMLQLKTIDICEDTINIKGKGSKHRNVFIPKRLKEILSQYLMFRDTSKKCNNLFTGKRGPINRKTVDSIIKKYAAKAHVNRSKAHAHNFRHLYCLSLVEKGLSIDTVADLAGHSNINTTRIYTRKTKNQLLETINDL